MFRWPVPPMKSLIVASSSVRRHDLLNRLGIDFRVVNPDVNETPMRDEVPRDLARRLAETKSLSVACERRQLILAADTVVNYRGRALGKPRDSIEAEEMLCKLSGSWHEVITAVAVRAVDERIVAHRISRVRFRELLGTEIREYAKTNEPLEAAGGYAIQGEAAKFIECLIGSYTNVVGLPMELARRLLWKIGIGQ